MSQKRPNPTDDLEKELADVDDDDIPDEISDEDLLNEDLDDPLFDEVDSLLDVKPKVKPKEPEPKKLAEKAKPEVQIQSKNVGSGVKSTGESKKVVISKEVVKELTIFLLQKQKIYEEIGFDTILRKIPKQWGFNEPILIDLLEILIEKDAIGAKMTAHTLKFFAKNSSNEKLKG